MNEDLQNEIEAINSIYGDGSLLLTDEQNIFILSLPNQHTSLRLEFPSDYPTSPPSVLGSQSSGEHTRKGEAAHIVEEFRNVLGRLFQPGEVCLFDVIEEVNNSLPNPDDVSDEENDENPSQSVMPDSPESADVKDGFLGVGEEPPWTLSGVVVELKSVFIARCAHVSSPDQAKQYLQYLLDTDKKVRTATHNITAWRTKGPNNVTFQDCDDDGEAAAGGRLLHLMQLMELWDVMVVVTRWYGGHHLGPKRFSLINSVARDAFVKGGFVVEEGGGKKKGKR